MSEPDTKFFGCCERPTCMKVCHAITNCSNCDAVCADCDINKRAQKIIRRNKNGKI